MRLRPASHAGPLPRMWDNGARHALGMKRHLLNLLSLLSLLLCVAAVVLWVRSYSVAHWGRLLRMPEAERGKTSAVVTDGRASADFGRLSVLTTRGPRELDWAYIM